MITELISALLQVIVFSLIPFLVYIIGHKTVTGFFRWIGLYRPTGKALLLSVALALVFVAGGITVALLNEQVWQIMSSPPSVTGKLRQMGMTPSAIATLLLIAWIKTSLSEEIFFRGFVAKRLVHKLGMKTGNLLQALIFALVHVLLFWALTKAGIAFLVFIFALSGLGAWLAVFINDKIGNGSIIPGWIAHALGNSISYFVIAFML